MKAIFTDIFKKCPQCLIWVFVVTGILLILLICSGSTSINLADQSLAADLSSDLAYTAPSVKRSLVPEQPS